ncbi:MAG TPA: lysozyme [Sphingomonas sp.]|nr:lysozyme [Sphingomonas sp.]
MTATLARPVAPKKSLAVVIGSALGAAALLTMVPMEESGRKVVATIGADQTVTVRHVSGPQYLRAYLDIVKVPTACDGITRGVRLGQTYTEAQCNALLEQELVAHAEPVIACVPRLYGRPNQAAAAVSLAYNVGTSGFCGSTAARRFNVGDWRGGCEAFLMWDKAGGRVVRGLQLRRQRERALCLKDLPR